jgi:hypothetical protein
MKVWRVFPDLTLPGLVFKNEAEIKVLRRVPPGTRFEDLWTPIGVENLENEALCDIPYLTTGFLVFSSRALQALLPLIQDEIEALPLVDLPEQFYLINMLQILDCLDMTRSEPIYFRDGLGIRGVKKFVFREECIEGKHVFKLSIWPRADVFVSDAFRAITENTQLKGLRLEEVWSG